MEYSVCHKRGTQKKSESPTGIELMTSRTPVARSNHGATGRLVAIEVICTEFVVTRVLHNARISNVESTVYDNQRKKCLAEINAFVILCIWHNPYVAKFACHGL